MWETVRWRRREPITGEGRGGGEKNGVLKQKETENKKIHVNKGRKTKC